MKRLLVALVLVLAAGCGVGADDGKAGCEIYRDALVKSPGVTKDPNVLDSVKGKLDGMDDETRRAFSDLLVAAEANPFLSSTDPDALDAAVNRVRSVCLSEHSVEIPN